MSGYGARVDALLALLAVGGAPTDQDFADLAMACLDLGGCTVGEQLAVMRIIEHRTSGGVVESLRQIVMGPAPDLVDPRLAVDVNVDAYGRRTVR